MNSAQSPAWTESIRTPHKDKQTHKSFSIWLIGKMIRMKYWWMWSSSVVVAFVIIVVNGISTEWTKCKWNKAKTTFNNEIRNIIIIILNIQGQARRKRMDEWMNDDRLGRNGNGCHFHDGFSLRYSCFFFLLLFQANCRVRCFTHFIVEWCYVNANNLTTSHSSWMIQLMCWNTNNKKRKRNETQWNLIAWHRV